MREGNFLRLHNNNINLKKYKIQEEKEINNIYNKNIK